jgi:hypothetical protein
MVGHGEYFLPIILTRSVGGFRRLADLSGYAIGSWPGPRAGRSRRGIHQVSTRLPSSVSSRPHSISPGNISGASVRSLTKRCVDQILSAAQQNGLPLLSMTAGLQLVEKRLQQGFRAFLLDNDGWGLARASRLMGIRLLRGGRGKRKTVSSLQRDSLLRYLAVS